MDAHGNAVKMNLLELADVQCSGFLDGKASFSFSMWHLGDHFETGVGSGAVIRVSSSERTWGAHG